MTPAASPTPNSDLTYSETRIGFDSGNSQATLTASGTVGLYDISSGQLNGTYQYNSHETYSYSESGEASYSLHEEGTFVNTTANFNSVVYSESAAGSYSESDILSETWHGEGTESTSATGTETSGGNTGGLRTNDNASFSYTLSSLSTVTAAGSWSSSDYEAGQYSDGSYSFSSAVHDEHAQDSASYAVTETLVREGTGTWVNDRSGISTSGVNGTFLFSAIPDET